MAILYNDTYFAGLKQSVANMETVQMTDSTKKYPCSKLVKDAVDELNDRIDNISPMGRFLSLWNCSTGLPATNPTSNPYVYKTGDYFIVGTVGATNYKPDGTQYVTGTASTTVETGTVGLNDIYKFDGTSWMLYHISNPTIATSITSASTNSQVAGAAAVYDIATLPRVEGDAAASITATQDANKMYVYDLSELSGEVTMAFTFNAPSDSTKDNLYMARVLVPAGVTVGTSGLNDVKWNGGSAPTFAAEKETEISIGISADGSTLIGFYGEF